MEAKLLRLKLKPRSLQKVDALLQKMKKDMNFVIDEMNQLKYFWDSVFIQTIDGNDYMYIVTKSEDFSKSPRQVLKSTPFREYYEAFKKECWSDDFIFIDSVWCPNKAVQLE